MGYNKEMELRQLKPITIQVTEKEKNLIEYIRKLGHGDFHVEVRDKQPFRIIQPKESILL